MAILLTGGTGKTSIGIAKLLQNAKIPFLLASRRGQAAAPFEMPAVSFNWLDSSTFPKPFEHEFFGGESISTVYLVAPETIDPPTCLNPFIDYAIKQHDVKRFVLLADSYAEVGGQHVGKVWQHLLNRHVDYCVLLPTWFMENFAEGAHLATIKNEGKIYTGFGDGKIPFIGVKDIAAIAFHALTDEKSHNTHYHVVGPELLTHDQIAEKLSSFLGRKIVHVNQTEDERIQSYVNQGLPDAVAKIMASLENIAAGGSEVRTNDVTEQVTGRPGQTFDTFVKENKAAWQ